MADAKSRVTFFDSKSTECPICGHRFKKEKLMTGRGRIVAGELTEELRRTYLESAKYGYVNPLIYSITICPECLYSAIDADFLKLDKKEKELIRNSQNARISKITSLFEELNLDFKSERTLESGTAGYMLCVMCYPFLDTKKNPTIKKGICSLRTAWLLGDLEEKYKTGKFAYFQEFFYKKAHKFYSNTLEFAQNGQEPLGEIFLGPDTDKNYGYDGIIYITSLLNFRLAYLEHDILERGNIYQRSKIMMAKIFGFGKSSKDKPSSILEQARTLYDQISSYLKQIEEELGTKF